MSKINLIILCDHLLGFNCLPVSNIERNTKQNKPQRSRCFSGCFGSSKGREVYRAFCLFSLQKLPITFFTGENILPISCQASSFFEIVHSLGQIIRMELYPGIEEQPEKLFYISQLYGTVYVTLFISTRAVKIIDRYK